MTVKVAISGVGNCASVFLQGLQFYSTDETKGLWHPKIAGLTPRDIAVVAAFDIDPRKAGLGLTEAAFAAPNVVRRHGDMPDSRVTVEPGIVGDGLPPHLRGTRPKEADVDAVAGTLKEAGADLLVNLISSGADAATGAYARAAREAHCGFVNCTPSLVNSKSAIVSLFRKAGLPLVGDDLMSQFGGTAFHKGLLELMVNRGVKVSKSYQLDVGGGSETLNTIDETIRMAKRTVKTATVASEVPYKFETVAGTTDYVDYMGNDRTSYFWFQGSGFMDSGISVDIYLRSSDGANAGNILLDVVRATYACAKEGELEKTRAISAYGFKSPPKPLPLNRAYSDFVSTFVR